MRFLGRGNLGLFTVQQCTPNKRTPVLRSTSHPLILTFSHSRILCGSLPTLPPFTQSPKFALSRRMETAPTPLSDKGRSFCDTPRLDSRMQARRLVPSTHETASDGPPTCGKPRIGRTATEKSIASLTSL